MRRPIFDQVDLLPPYKSIQTHVQLNRRLKAMHEPKLPKAATPQPLMVRALALAISRLVKRSAVDAGACGFGQNVGERRKPERCVERQDEQRSRGACEETSEKL